MMDKVEMVEVCRVGAVVFSGMFAGASLYANMVQMPALRTVKDTTSYRQYWKQQFLIAGKSQPILSLGTMATAAVVSYYDDTDQRRLWMTGVALMSSILPWTAVAMLPDIKILLNDNVIDERGESWVREAVELWNKRHALRTVIGMTSFGIFLYCISSRK